MLRDSWRFLYGDVRGKIKICLFTDSESTLECVASSKQVDRKTFRMIIVNLKERLTKGDITSYAWLPTERMWVDLLTKEKRLLQQLEDVLMMNDMDLGDTEVNEVKAFGQDVRMESREVDEDSGEVV